MRILVIKTSSFGDIIQLFPALAMLHSEHPEAKLDFVINPEFAPLLEFAPFPVNKTIIFDRQRIGRMGTFLPCFAALVKEIRKEKYDFAIDFQGLFRNAVIAGVARANIKAGFAVPREKAAKIFYNRPVQVDAVHAVERYGELARKLFSLTGELKPQIAPVQPRHLAGLPVLPPHYAVLLPGSRWESKRFPPELFRKIVKIIHLRFPEMQFFAAGSDAESSIGDKLGPEISTLFGKTSVGGLMELLRGADFVIGNDSGPLHAAAAMGVPVFGLYGATVPSRTGPWGRNTTVFTAETSCGGCLKRKCRPGSYRCMALDADNIAETIIKKMEKTV